MKRIISVLIGVVLLAVLGALYFKRGDIAVELLRRGADKSMESSTLDGLPDGLHAAFCGTGAPFPDRQRAGPCLGVVAGKRLFVFDAGEGASETLSLMGLPPANVEAVFLTHVHSDHIDGLGALALQRWASGGAHAPLPVYGASVIERVVAGFNEAYAIDATYRVAHHGASVVPPGGFGLVARPFALPEGQDRAVVFNDGGVRIIAFTVDHGPIHPALGYRIEYKGRSIVVSGDTGPSPTLTREAEGADLLVHDALSRPLTNVLVSAARKHGRANLAQIFHDIQNYHATPEQAAEAAQQAHVHALALTHLVPPLRIRLLEGPFLGDARSRFDGPLWIAHDGDLISLPASGGIEHGRAL